MRQLHWFVLWVGVRLAPPLALRLGAIAFVRRLDELLRKKDVEPAEVFCGGGAFTWGLVLLAPANSFSSTITFTTMALVAPEWAWGLVAVLVGGNVLAGMFLGGWYPIRKWRSCATFVCFLFWLFCLALFALGNPVSTATGVYPWFALAAAWAYLRLKRPRRLL